MFGLIEFSGRQDPCHPCFQLSFLRNLVFVICLIALGEGQSRDCKDVCAEVPEDTVSPLPVQSALGSFAWQLSVTFSSGLSSHSLEMCFILYVR